jgi:hypothetical protein
MKKPLSKVAHNQLNFFSVCQPAQNQPKSPKFFIEISHRATSL